MGNHIARMMRKMLERFSSVAVTLAAITVVPATTTMIASGTIPVARFSGYLPAVIGPEDSGRQFDSADAANSLPLSVPQRGPHQQNQ